MVYFAFDNKVICIMLFKILKDKSFKICYWFFSRGYSLFCYIILKIFFKKKKITFKKLVYIIGSGPSVDLLDLKKIKNSTVILLNNFHVLYDEIDESNTIYCFVQDIGFFNKKFKYFQPKIKNIIIPTTLNLKLNYIFKLLKYKNKSYIFFPKYNFFLKKKIFYRKKSSINFSTYGFFSNLFYRPKSHEINSIKQIWTAPHSVMFTAIYFSKINNAKKIILLGFDNNNFDNNTYSNKLNISLNEKKIEISNYQKYRLLKRGRKMFFWYNFFKNSFIKQNISLVSIGNNNHNDFSTKSFNNNDYLNNI